MKRSIYGVLMLLTFSGCISIPVSPTPRFYSLHSLSTDEATQTQSVPAGMSIDFGPVRIPEYQNRPQIVTKNKDTTLNFSEFNRWAEHLDLAFEYAIGEDLAAMLPGATVKIHPWYPADPAKYQITVDVVRLESELEKDLFFAAQWTVIDVKTKKPLLTRRSEFRQPISPHNYHGLVETLSTACVLLSADMAKEMTSLNARTETKENEPVFNQQEGK